MNAEIPHIAVHALLAEHLRERIFAWREWSLGGEFYPSFA